MWGLKEGWLGMTCIFPAGAIGVVGGGAIHEDRMLRVASPKHLSWSSFCLFQFRFNLMKIFSLPVGRLKVLLCFLFCYSRSKEFPWIDFPMAVQASAVQTKQHGRASPQGALGVPGRKPLLCLCVSPVLPMQGPRHQAWDPQ